VPFGLSSLSDEHSIPAWKPGVDDGDRQMLTNMSVLGFCPSQLTFTLAIPSRGTGTGFTSIVTPPVPLPGGAVAGVLTDGGTVVDPSEDSPPEHPVNATLRVTMRTAPAPAHQRRAT
jgi:hypothetical protein